ncbi:MAG: DUF4286 family protein [Myxococcota bacterium]
MLAYTVRGRFDDPAVGERWLGWLRDKHLKDVCDAGALRAEVVRLDGEPQTFEARYYFPSREVFATYQAEHGPRLRAEGLELFPTSLGIHYERSLGPVEERFPSE